MPAGDGSAARRRMRGDPDADQRVAEGDGAAGAPGGGGSRATGPLKGTLSRRRTPAPGNTVTGSGSTSSLDTSAPRPHCGTRRRLRALQHRAPDSHPGQTRCASTRQRDSARHSMKLAGWPSGAVTGRVVTIAAQPAAPSIVAISTAPPFIRGQSTTHHAAPHRFARVSSVRGRGRSRNSRGRHRGVDWRCRPGAVATLPRRQMPRSIGGRVALFAALVGFGACSVNQTGLGGAAGSSSSAGAGGIAASGATGGNSAAAGRGRRRCGWSGRRRGRRRRRRRDGNGGSGGRLVLRAWARPEPARQAAAQLEPGWRARALREVERREPAPREPAPREPAQRGLEPQAAARRERARLEPRELARLVRGPRAPVATLAPPVRARVASRDRAAAATATPATPAAVRMVAARTASASPTGPARPAATAVGRALPAAPACAAARPAPASPTRARAGRSPASRRR